MRVVLLSTNLGFIQLRGQKVFQILTSNILPVFSIMVLGFVLGRMKFVSSGEATTLNRIAFLILQPALIFPLVNSVDLSTFYLDAILIYAVAQAIVFTCALIVAAFIFKCTLIEAWLLAMTTVFVNSLLYIWPISLLIYGDDGNLPIMAAVVWDATVTFAFFIITTDLLANKGQSLVQSIMRLVKNPVLITIALGLGTNIFGINAVEPILIACKFAGAGAAPLTLFALGVILSGQRLALTKKVTVIVGMKLFLLPFVAVAFLQWGDRPTLWNELLLLNAAGPSGAMAFALALLYKVRTDTIAPVIIWTSVLTLVSLAWLA